MTTNIDKIKQLKQSAETLKNLIPKYNETIKDNRCDKHNLAFGGDDRFSVFSCKVFLDCHTGYYGSSSCSTYAYVDQDHAKDLLNKALNKHMELILNTMAEFAEQEAAALIVEARKEVDKLNSLLDSVGN